MLRSDSTYTYQEEVKKIVMATEITAVAIFGYQSDMNKVRSQLCVAMETDLLCVDMVTDKEI